MHKHPKYKGEAGKLVSETKRSGEVVGNAIEAMGKIENSSRSVSSIMGVIDDIKSLINTSSEQVRKGVGLVGKNRRLA